MKIAIATIATVLAFATTAAEASPHGHGRGHHGHHGHRTAELIIPVLIGGVIGYEIARQNPPVIAQPQIIVQPPQRSQVPQPINVPGIECPAGTAPFWNVTYDHFHRPNYIFIGCR